MKNRKIGLLSISLSIAVCLFGGTFSHNKKVLTEEEKIMLGKDLWAMPAEVPVNGIEYTENPTYTEKTNANIFLGHMNFGTTRDYYRGDGVKVAVIDSGVNYLHEDFYDSNGNCVISELSASILLNSSQTAVVTKKVSQYGMSVIDDTNGHGTNVASTIASQINGKGSLGVAPNIELVILKTNYNFAEIATALNYCVTNKINIVNMSIQSYENDVIYNGKTYAGSGSSITTYLNDYTSSCYKNGIAVFAAGGNYATNEPSYPANNTNVLAVGALARNSSTNIASYSNTGPNVDVVGPGSVYVANIGGTAEYTETQGTSFACPAVAGAAALYKQLHPTASPSEIYNDLKNSCYDLGTKGVDDIFGYGRVDISEFVKPPVYVETITPNMSSIKVAPGKTVQLACTVSPYNATNKELVYISKNESIATVSDTGLVTGVSEGSTSIFVGAADEGNAEIEIPVTVAELTGEPKTVSKEWTLTSSNTDWTASGNDTYFSQPYGYKANGGTLVTTNSIEDFTKTNKTEIKVSFKCLQNGGSSSKITIYLYDSSGNVLGSEVFTPVNKSSASSTEYCTATFTSNLTNAAKIGMKVTTFGKNILVNGAKYELTYLDSGSTPTTKTLESISVSGPKTSFTVGETFTFNGTVTATYSDNSTANVTNNATFIGNNTSTAGTKTVTVSYTESGVTKTTTYTITVNAQTTTTYTVTFNANGHGSAPSAVTVNAGGTVTEPSNPSATGWTFGGWYTDSGCTNAYNFNNAVNSSFTLFAKWTQNSSSTDDFNGYYSEIDANSTTLLSDLRTLNLRKRTNTVGYNSMGTSTSTNPDSSPYMYTDYDPSTIRYQNGQPYGTKILSFYSGNSTTGWNKEHVWPASRLTGGRNGNIVDDDIYMARPTISSENSNRGNSVFYEGMAHSSNGWDPVTAFGTNGVYTSIRGECARIIFYCMTVDSSLVLNESTSNSGNNMGRLTDLLKWNLENPVNDREVRRQSGGEYLQGNRNAFVDHPEYACKIWGNTSDATRKICSMDPVTNKKLVDLTVSGTPSKTVYQKGENFSPNGLTVTATFDDETSSNVTSSVVWTPSPLDVGVTEVTGTYTYLNETKTVTITGLIVNPWTVVNGDYTLEFKNSTADGSGELTSKVIMSDDYLKLNTLASEMTSVNKVYAGTYGLKLGSSGSAGSFTVNLVDGAKNGIKSIDIYSKKYSSDSGTIKFTLGSKSGSFTPTTTGTKQTQTFDEPISAQTLKIETSSKRGYVQKVVLHVEDSSTPKVTSVSLNPKTLSFDLYQSTATKTITATVLGDTDVDTSVVWTSSNKGVATVSDGVVTPIGVGQTTITATSTVDSSKSDTCVVTVSDSTPIAVTGVSLDKINASVSLGSTLTLTATIEPSNATNKNVAWSSSDESVATVSDGVVTSKAVGTATITVTTEEGGFTASCTVTVTAAPVITYQLEADQETVPYMSGTNHQVSVGVKLYKYSNGVKGSQVASSTGSVDTSVLGPAKISYTYQSVTYETSVKVTNNGAIQNIEGTSTNKTSTFTKSIFTKNETQKVDDLSLTLSNNGTYYGYDSAKGQQIGSSNKPAKSMSLTTSVEGTITKVTVNTSGGSNVSATVSVRVGSTSFKCGTSTSKSISDIATSYEFTGSASGDIVISWSQTSSKALYFKSIEITTTTAGTKVFSNEEQAKAWSDYFIKLTGGGEFDGPCKLGTPEAKKAALQQVWGELKSEYDYMVEGSKTAFCSVDATETIAEAAQHYRYIVNTYGLEDFAEVPQIFSSNRLIPVVDSQSFVLVIVAMVGSLTICGLLVYKKRKEK